MRSLLVLPALALLLPGAAAAYEWEEPLRLDHRNQPSVLGAVSFEQLIVTGREKGEEAPKGPGALVDVAVGLPLDEEGGEGFLGVRAGGGEGGARIVAPYLFYRGYAGEDEWKTFFDAGALLRIEPLWAVAARLGVGVQYDFAENLGTYFAAGASVGYGEGLQVGLDAGLGLQLRFGTPG